MNNLYGRGTLKIADPNRNITQRDYAGACDQVLRLISLFLDVASVTENAYAMRTLTEAAYLIGTMYRNDAAMVN
ncbi:MAG: hypothetical protein VB957_09645 [Pseudomonadales bacterium]